MGDYFMMVEKMKPGGFDEAVVVRVRKRVIWRLIKLVEGNVRDPRQGGKVRHPLKNIIVFCFC